MQKLSRICPHCGKPFKTKRGFEQIEYCSKECSEKEHSKMLIRMGITPVENYEKLAEAIVLQAVDDYREIKPLINNESSDEEWEALRELEDFFLSEDFGLLMPRLNGPEVLRLLATA